MRLLTIGVLALCLAGAAEARDSKPAGAENVAAKDFPIRFGGPFELIDHTGKNRSDRDFRGRFMLVYFVFGD